MIKFVNLANKSDFTFIKKARISKKMISYIDRLLQQSEENLNKFIHALFTLLVVRASSFKMKV